MKNYKNLYQQAYQKLNRCTPLKFDCGRLCEKGCCQEPEQAAGMWLFPGEEEMLTGEADFIIRSLGKMLSTGRPLLWLDCQGSCHREYRPLACRIFPLTPFLRNEIVTMEIDPRAKQICPLGQGKEQLQREFIQKVGHVCRELAKEPEIFEYYKILTEEAEDYYQMIKLFKQK